MTTRRDFLQLALTAPLLPTSLRRASPDSRIEAAAFPEGSPTRLQIGRASIAWQGWDQGADRGLELRLQLLDANVAGHQLTAGQ